MAQRKSDTEIVGMFFDRDEEALRLTESAYGRYMHSLSYAILGDDGDSAECTNDALLALWDHIPPDRPVCFKAYLTRLVRNLALMRLRAKNTAKRAPGEYTAAFEDLCETLENGVSVEEEYESGRLRALIDGFLRALPRKKRYIFIARYCHSAKISQIAREMKTSERSVYNALSAMKKELKNELKKEGF